MLKENWKPVVGYEGSYEVSDLGRVRSLNRVVDHCHKSTKTAKGCMLSPGIDRKGYKRVNLWGNNKYETRLVHTLVCLAFIGPCPEGKTVLHGPNGSSDNRVSQLRYGTHSDNAQDKLRDETYYRTPVIRSDGVRFKGPKQAADLMGESCSSGNIVLCCQGIRHTHKGYGWSYA